MVLEFFLILDVIGLGILLGGGIYESAVINPNGRANIPDSLSHLRNFMKVRTPANLFRVASPATMISLIVTVIFCWQMTAALLLFLCAFVVLAAADTITYTFHYQRNKILFIDPLSSDTEMLQRLAKQRQTGNLVRIALMTIAMTNVVFGIVSLASGSGA